MAFLFFLFHTIINNIHQVEHFEKLKRKNKYVIHERKNQCY